jgi:hypothetical protein
MTMMRLRMRWIYRLLHRVLAGDTPYLHTLFFISNRILRLHFRRKQEGRCLGFTAFTSGWIGLVGWCHCFLHPAIDQPSSLAGEVPEIMDTHFVVLFCIVIIVV